MSPSPPATPPRLTLDEAHESLVREVRRGQDAEQREIYSFGRSVEAGLRAVEERIEQRSTVLLWLILIVAVIAAVGLFATWYRLGRLEQRLFPREGPKSVIRLRRR